MSRRRRVGIWGGRYFVSVCVLGYGVSLGVGTHRGKAADRRLVVFFKNVAYSRRSS